MPDVDALLRGMTSAQLAGWATFAELEPFGPLREDQRAAAIVCGVTARIPLQGKGAKALRPGDVFSSLAPPHAGRFVAGPDMAALARGLTAMMGGAERTIPRGDTGGQKRRPRDRDRRRPVGARQ